jgi:CRP-like cAMP-binding protein
MQPFAALNISFSEEALMRRVPSEIFGRKLRSIAHVSEQDEEALASLGVRTVDVPAARDIVSAGARCSHSCFLVEGFAGSYQVTAAGKRQFSAFYIAGDAPDLQSLYLETLDSGVCALTRCVVGYVEHAEIKRLCEKSPTLAAVLWRYTLIDAAIFREWVTNVGQRDAVTRVAHLFCEMSLRLRYPRNLLEQMRFNWPLTQAELADACGVSSVHINRVLKEMRWLGLVELSDGQLGIKDWNRLVAAGEFNADYLHFKRTPAVRI